MELMGSNIVPHGVAPFYQILLFARVNGTRQKVKIKRLQPIMTAHFVIDIQVIKNENVASRLLLLFSLLLLMLLGSRALRHSTNKNAVVIMMSAWSRPLARR